MSIIIVLLVLMDSVVNAAPRMKRQYYYPHSSQHAMLYQPTQYNYNSGYQHLQYYRGRCGYCNSGSYFSQPQFYGNPHYNQYYIQYPELYGTIQSASAVGSYTGWYSGEDSRPTGYGRPQNIPHSLPRKNNNFPSYSVRLRETYDPQVYQNKNYVGQTYENRPIEKAVPDLSEPETRLVEKELTIQQPVPETLSSTEEEAKRLGEQIEKSVEGPQEKVLLTMVAPSSHLISARAHSANSQLKPSEKKTKPLMVMDGESTSDQDLSNVLANVFALIRTMLPEVHTSGWNGQDFLLV